ncbi:MAG: c-type cytochrome [Nannocystis sp.]|nr:c-type cytochrome [Nannocystis sp.]
MTPRMHRVALPFLALALACEETSDVDVALAGGDTTVFDSTGNAFALSARNMSFDRRQHFVVGNSFFNKNWVAAPSSTASRDGLGPTFNARSCSTCHRKDGRGRPPGPGEEFTSMLLRLSLPGVGAHGGPLAAGPYGDQLQPQAIAEVPAEGTPRVRYVERAGQFADGTTYSLRVPNYTIESPSLGPLPAGLLISPRVAPAMIGMGLLAAIPEADLLARADPDDDDGDGISGRPNRVWDAAAGEPALGRFGWKANQPSVRQQTAGAFLGDMGISSSLFTDQNCPEGQAACAAAPTGGAPEIDDDLLADVVFYSSTLAVPARRDLGDPAAKRGEQQFLAAGCDACHTPRQRTAADDPLIEAAGQTIFPYTDLLLHDMGPELADGRPDYEASGSEWRTPPLWGIGLIETVNGHSDLLHDGRARSRMEAVLWHGGEGQAARDAVLTLSADERADLDAFLRSL